MILEMKNMATEQMVRIVHSLFTYRQLKTWSPPYACMNLLVHFWKAFSY